MLPSNVTPGIESSSSVARRRVVRARSHLRRAVRMVACPLAAAVGAALNVVADMFEAWKRRVSKWRFKSVGGDASARAVGYLSFENADFKRKGLV